MVGAVCKTVMSRRGFDSLPAHHGLPSSRAMYPTTGCGLMVSHLVWGEVIMGVRFSPSRPKPPMGTTI